MSFRCVECSLDNSSERFGQGEEQDIAANAGEQDCYRHEK